MEGMMYVLGLILALLAGFHVTRNPDWRRRSTTNGSGSVEEAKTTYEESTKFHRDGWTLYGGAAVIHLGVFIGFLVLFTIIIAIIDFTYAHYIGSVRSFLAFALAASIIGLVVSMLLRSMTGESDIESVKERLGRSKTSTIMMFMVLLTVVMFGTIALGGAMAAVCVVPLIALLVILAVIMLRMRKRTLEEGGVKAGSIKGRLSSIRWVDTSRKIVAMLTLIILIISSFYAYIAPSSLDDNTLYASLDVNEVSGDNNMTLEDPQEVRVVSWLLATQYLERSYGDSASFLDSSEGGLLKYTDPSYVNGRFVWVNAPAFEAWKWFGGKKVPFFVYVENDPANISEESTRMTHKVDLELETHEIRVTWQKRLEQLCFDRYAVEFEISQIRFTIDDDENPFWIIYLARRDTFFNRLYLERLLIVNAEDFEDNTEYGIQDEDIPDWLEVVFPDFYVYDWVKFWGNYRLGLTHLWFDKSHLYEPDDMSARFIVVQGNTYWQIPLVQKSSHVLGGYVWVDTRTGEATFYNREDHSLADKDTVEAQVQKYLSYNPEDAKAMLLAEGYPEGTLKFTVDIPAYGNYAEIAALFQSSFEDIGVTMDTNSLESSAFWARMGNHDLLNDAGMSHGDGEFAQGPASWFRKGPGGGNYGKFYDPWIQAEFYRIPRLKTAEERAAAYKEYFVYVMDKAVRIWWPGELRWTVWQPWVKRYSGEPSMLKTRRWEMFTYAWIDQELKGEFLGEDLPPNRPTP